ncbi:hypothetical protein [Roseovarius sp. 2305UL8-3]|uniref:hypothetical protein n=1 Tax=Roseovarius conchicola TaxID=3121636 RepID=UPI003527BC65
MLKSITLALGFVAALGTQAIAMNSLPYVPSLWPAEGAFDTGKTSPSISSKNADTPASSQQPHDR